MRLSSSNDGHESRGPAARSEGWNVENDLHILSMQGLYLSCGAETPMLGAAECCDMSPQANGYGSR